MNIIQIINDFFDSTGISAFFQAGGWKNLIMIVIGLVFLFLAIKKGFEPYLLIPIAFGIILTNIPGSDVFIKEEILDEGGNIVDYKYSGLIGYLYLGVKYEIYPCLIFLGIGATTDFGPLIANKKTMLLGAAAQIGIFVAFFLAICLGFNSYEAASIGIIGGADGPTAILVSSTMLNASSNSGSQGYLAPIALAAYSYMALVPVIFPPIIRLFTTKKERLIHMEQLREVSKKEKILFPIIVTLIVCLIVPAATPLIGCLMLGNLIKESGVVPNLVHTVANALLYICTICLGISVGATAIGQSFLTLGTSKVTSVYRLGSNDLSSVIIGLIFFAVLISEFFIRYKLKFNPRKIKNIETKEELA